VLADSDTDSESDDDDNGIGDNDSSGDDGRRQLEHLARRRSCKTKVLMTCAVVLCYLTRQLCSEQVLFLAAFVCLSVRTKSPKLLIRN